MTEAEIMKLMSKIGASRQQIMDITGMNHGVVNKFGLDVARLGEQKRVLEATGLLGKTVREMMLTLWGEDCCIATTKLLIEVWKRFGVTGRVGTYQVAALNPIAANDRRSGADTPSVGASSVIIG
jgi:hypothetical protein